MTHGTPKPFSERLRRNRLQIIVTVKKKKCIISCVIVKNKKLRWLTSRWGCWLLNLFFRFEFSVWTFGLNLYIICRFLLLWARSTGSLGSWSWSPFTDKCVSKRCSNAKSELVLVNYQINSLYLHFWLITYL